MANSVCNSLLHNGKLAANNIHIISSKIGVLPNCVQTRLSIPKLKWFGRKNYWPQFSMIKDNKHRMALLKDGALRNRYNAMRKNNILPPELLALADEEIKTKVDINSCMLRIVPRCALTSRPRGTVFRWRLSRIIFRSLADHNKLAGVQRGIW